MGAASGLIDLSFEPMFDRDLVKAEKGTIVWPLPGHGHTGPAGVATLDAWGTAVWATAAGEDVSA